MIGLKVQGVNNFTALQWNHDVWFLAIFFQTFCLSKYVLIWMIDIGRTLCTSLTPLFLPLLSRASARINCCYLVLIIAHGWRYCQILCTL